MRGVALALLLAAACAAPPALAADDPASDDCMLPGQHKMMVTELFFGRDLRGGGKVSDAEWADFLANVVTENFPDGLTVFDGYGQWRNPATGVIGRSPGVKIVLIAATRSADLAARLQAVTDAYKNRFHQKSVGVITRESCAAF